MQDKHKEGLLRSPTLEWSKKASRVAAGQGNMPQRAKGTPASISHPPMGKAWALQKGKLLQVEAEPVAWGAKGERGCSRRFLF